MMEIMTITSPYVLAVATLLLGTVIGAAASRFLWKSADTDLLESRAADAEKRATLEIEKCERLREENVGLQRLIAASEARAETERESFERERSAASADAARLEHAFRSIGSDVLREATEMIERRSGESQSAHERAVRGIIDPVAVTLGAMSEHIAKVEIERRGDYEGLASKVESLGKIEYALGERITDLVGAASGLAQALRNPSVRGSWGEFHLRKVLEISGMLAHCDFEEQRSVASEEGLQRPDVVVHLAGERHVYVDAKAPLAAFLDAVESTDERRRAESLKRHAQALRAHVRTLASRNYGKRSTSNPDMVLMYVPSEGALHAALAEDPGIIEDALESNVTVTGPIHLITLLRLFATGWRQQEFEKGAHRVVELAAEFHERIGKVGEHMRTLHSSVTNVVKAYNALTGSMETRVLPTARKLEALGAARPSGEQTEIPQIFEGPRILAAQELTGTSD